MIKNKILPFLAATALFISSSLAADLKQAATSKVSNELNGAKNKAINNVISSFENFITESFPRTEISVTGAEELKPQWEILTVQPLRDDGENITFFQGSLLRWDGERVVHPLWLMHTVGSDSGPGRRGAPGRSAAAMRVRLPCACANAARR